MDGINGNDFQHNNIIYVLNTKEQVPNPRGLWINMNNLIPVSVYFAVRHSIPATWLNDRDQFLFPNDGWQSDLEFQSDCLAYSLFQSQNRISNSDGTNHWIPFKEQEVNAKEKFASSFMTDFITGKLKPEAPLTTTLFENETKIGIYNNKPIVFSDAAKAVFNAGRNLWLYYHQHQHTNVNASLYDIREYFQGRNDKGRMNARSTDLKYTELIAQLRVNLTILANQIKPKVYEYGFLKE